MTSNDEAQAHTEAITLLLGAAETSGEINAITRVALRAGFLWRCPKCREDHYPTAETCGCGVRRKAAAEASR